MGLIDSWGRDRERERERERERWGFEDHEVENLIVEKLIDYFERERERWSGGSRVGERDEREREREMGLWIMR